jgi:UDP-N-acetylmuramoyl-L-alanyl-D-glutamate--2,6-diaminopimelate ligase
MELNELLVGVPVTKMFQTVFGKMASTHDVMVSGIHYDSRSVERGGVFVALRGAAVDGHRFIGDAIARGAKVIVTEDDTNPPDPLCMHTGTVKLVVANARKALALMSATYYGHPARKLSVIGVTGTNGKTTTAYLIKQLLETDAKVKAGLIGTIEYAIGSTRLPATHTTPESLELHKLFARMVSEGCTHCVMEVSSHALHQDRVYGIPFAAAVFTNLTQDHLDYHGTMEKYLKAKKLLFDSLSASAVAVINADSPQAEEIVRDAQSRVVTYGIATDAMYRATTVSMSTTGFTADVNGVAVAPRMTGLFNVSNFLAAYATVSTLNPSLAITAEQIARLNPAPGRFEQMHSSHGWTAVVDYAHTPDALENCLKTIRAILPAGSAARVTTVFGAGGDRDVQKRPLMGGIAERYSDKIVVTSDNPRSEDQQAIADGILGGMTSTERVTVELDRRTAIEGALASALPGDVVLIAGKGHEDYQVIGTTKIHFSDKEIVARYL